MTNKHFIPVTLILVMACSDDRNIRLSTPEYDPLVVKLESDGAFEPVRINGSGGGIDLGYKTTYTAPGKRVFKVRLSDGQPESFTGYNVEAVFHHYSKLLSVEYQSADSVNRIKFYNNPISWTADP